MVIILSHSANYGTAFYSGGTYSTIWASGAERFSLGNNNSEYGKGSVAKLSGTRFSWYVDWNNSRIDMPSHQFNSKDIKYLAIGIG